MPRTSQIETQLLMDMRMSGLNTTITRGPRSLALFMDRYEAIRGFAAYLNGSPARREIIFFHGDGGNGKSLLLRYLREHCCKRLTRDEWLRVQSLGGEAFKVALEQAANAPSVPCVLLDFAMLPQGADRPQETLPGLLMLRRALALHGFHFPYFDTAAVHYLVSMHHSEAEIKSYFPGDQHGLIGLLVVVLSAGGAVAPLTAATGIAAPATIAGAVLAAFSDKLGAWFTRYGQRRQLGPSEIEEIRSLDPRSDLLDALPSLFSKDLNTAMALDQTIERVVLIFDGHDAFWGEHTNSSSALAFRSDEWLRRLLNDLDLSAGVVAVVAGRERPLWPTASIAPVATTALDYRPVGHLCDADALAYLDKVGVDDVALRQRIIDVVRVGADQVHPFYLGLGADVVLEAMARGVTLTADTFPSMPQVATKGQMLVDRLLLYADDDVAYAVRALSACRAFNEDIYHHLGAALRYAPTVPAFIRLTRFSFIWRTEQRGQGWYRVHDLVRRLMYERGAEETARAHVALEEYYRQRAASGDMDAVIEAIYHANRVEHGRGVEEWTAALTDALHHGLYGMCTALLTLRVDLLVDTAFGRARVAQAEGDYYKKVARYSEAEQAYQETINAAGEVLVDSASDNDDIESTLILKAAALGLLAEVDDVQARFQPAGLHYREALALYEEIVQRFPASLIALHNRATLLQSYGQFQARLSEHVAAATSFRHAAAAYNKVLALNPDHTEVYNNRGSALLGLAMLQATLGRRAKAISTCKRAITTLDEGIQRHPDRYALYLNKGGVLQQLAEIQEVQGEDTVAADMYEQAITTLDEALRWTRDDSDIYNNKGIALSRLGRLHLRFGRFEQSAAATHRAIAQFNAALERAPGHIRALSNKGLALALLAQAQAGLLDDQAAIDTYSQALLCFDDALACAVHDIDMLVGKGSTLSRLGEIYHQRALQQDRGQVAVDRRAALDHYAEALSAFDTVLQSSPNDVSAHFHRGRALLLRAQLYEAIGDDERAIESYKAAVDAYDAVVKRAADMIDALKEKGYALLALAKVQCTHAQRMDALTSAIVASSTLAQALAATQKDERLRAAYAETQILLNKLSGR